MGNLELTFSHYEQRFDSDGWMYMVAVYRDVEGRTRIIPVDD